MVNWSFSVDEVDNLHGGTSGGGGDAEKKCSDNDGQITGIGPSCIRDEESGKKSLFVCFFQKAQVCAQTFESTMWGCWRYAGNCGPSAGYYIQSDCADASDQVAKGCDDAYSACTKGVYNQLVSCIMREECRDSCEEGCASTATAGYVECGNAHEPCSEGAQAVYEGCRHDPEQACDGKAQLDYQECIDKIPNACECKNCENRTSGGGKPEEPEPDVPEEPEPDVPEPKAPVVSTLTSNSGYVVIPRVFGRYVVAGNVLWIGNEREAEITYSITNDDKVTEYTDLVKKIDFLVGMCVGPMNGVLRIWMNDLLIYNDTLELDEDGNVILTNNNGSTELNAASMADSEYNLERLAAYVPTITFLSGSAAQKVQGSIANDEGFGRVPAERGIACVMFKDVDVNLFNARTFPKFRFEVYSTTPEIGDPVITSEVEDVDEVSLNIDQRTRMVYALNGAQDAALLYDFDTLELVSTAAVAAPIHMMKSGYIWSDGDIVDPWKDEVRATVGSTTPASYSEGMIYYDGGFPFELAMIADSVTNNIKVVSFDYSDETAELLTTYSSSEVYAVDKAIVAALGDYISYVQFAVQGANLRVLRYDMLNASNVLLETPLFTSSEVNVGDMTGEMIIGLVRYTADNSFHLFFSNGKIAKLNSSLAVVGVAQGPVLSLPGELTTVTSDTQFYFADGTDDAVYMLDLSTGEITTYGGLEEPITGAQYFDSRTRSLLYVTADGLTRVFLDRTIPNRLAFSDILDGLAIQLGVSDIFKTSEVADAYLDGFMIDYKVNLAQIFTQLMELYQVGIVDDGTTLTVVSRTTYTDQVDLTQATDVQPNGIVTSRLAANSQVNTVTATFVQIDDTGLIDETQSATINPELDQDDIRELTFTVKLLDNPTSIREHLEKVLINRRSSSSTANITTLPRALAVTPQDRITINGETYRVGATTFGPDFGTMIEAAGYDKENMDVTVTLDAAVLTQGSELVRPTKHPVYRPVVLFMPSINNEDVTRALSGIQVIFTGIDAAERDIESTTFAVRIGNSPSYTTEDHTESVHVGFVTAIPDDLYPEQFITDVDSTLVIDFEHEDTVDLLGTYTLLIVGREYIRFGAYNHLGEGVVEFTILSRGQYSTDPYMRDHAVGERAYLYTPDSLKTLAIDPAYTRLQPVAKVSYKRPLPAGVNNLVFNVRSDGGSIRPPAPGDLRRFMVGGDPFVGYFDWQHRRGYEVNNIEHCGALADDYPSADGAAYILFFLAAPGELVEFEDKVIRLGLDFIDPAYALSYTTFSTPNAVISLPIDPLIEPLHVALVQAHDGYIGQPSFITFPPGNYPEAPVTP